MNIIMNCSDLDLLIVQTLVEFFKWLGHLRLSNQFLSDLAAFEGILIGAGMPISLQIVNWTLARYEDQEISQFFIKETLYKWQLILFPTSILVAILLRLLDIKSPYFLWPIFLWLVINVCVFIGFIKIVERYAAQPDEVLLAKLNKDVDAILQK